MTKNKLIREFSETYHYTVWQNGCFRRTDFFIFGFDFDLIRKNELNVFFKLTSLMPAKYVSKAKVLPGTIEIPMVDQKGMPSTVFLDKIDSIPENVRNFEELIRSILKSDEALSLSSIINLSAYFKSKNFSGLRYFVHVDEFLLHLLAFSSQKEECEALKEKLIESLTTTDENIIRNHFYSDYERWKDRICNTRNHIGFLSENIKWNIEEFELDKVKEEYINLER